MTDKQLIALVNLAKKTFGKFEESKKSISNLEGINISDQMRCVEQMNISYWTWRGTRRACVEVGLFDEMRDIDGGIS